MSHPGTCSIYSFTHQGAARPCHHQRVPAWSESQSRQHARWPTPTANPSRSRE